jgi:hypothetical protein
MKLSFFLSVGLILLLNTFSAFAQKNFDNPNVEYTFTFPSDEWKITVEPSELSPNVELNYNIKKEGNLEIRKLTIEPNTLFGDIIREEEQKLQFVPGYVTGKEENFLGAYSGRVFNYEYVRSGRPMSGRFYYLKTDDKTVYVLRFTGLKDILRSIRNETDSIARTFKIKEKK